MTEGTMHIYIFTGRVWYREPNTPHDLEPLDTTITIRAPNKRTAVAVFANYGMDGANERTVERLDCSDEQTDGAE